MHACLDKLTLGLSQGCLEEDVTAFFCHHGKPKTTSHSAAVAVKASNLASHFGLDPVRAWQAGWLHDVSAVIPNAERVAYARALGLEVLPEEIAAAYDPASKTLSHPCSGDIFYIRCGDSQCC